MTAPRGRKSATLLQLTELTMKSDRPFSVDNPCGYTIQDHGEAVKSSKAKLAYQKAYNAKPENIAKRVKNNAARREAMEKGLVKKGDGKDVDHKKMLDEGGGNSKSNLRVTSQKENRGWRKKKPGVYD